MAAIPDRKGGADIYVMDADGGNVRQLTDDPGGDYSPTLLQYGEERLMSRGIARVHEDFFIERINSGLGTHGLPQLSAVETKFLLSGPLKRPLRQLNAHRAERR